MHNSDLFLDKLSKRFNLSKELLREYHDLFKKHDVPFSFKNKNSKRAERIVMVSTHGYWENPPPTGLPDTGGQTYYVLEVSKSWAKQGRKVIIVARWFEPYPRMEQFDNNLWLIRIRAGGNNFIRKEDIYPLVREMAEAETAIAALFGASAVVGHYADGMAGASEVAFRTGIPLITIPHSLGLRKVETLGFDPFDPETWLNKQYNFWQREDFEIAALRNSDLEIANTPREPDELKNYYGETYPHLVMQAGAGDEFFRYKKKRSDKTILSEYGLVPNKYLIFFGRFSESKNIPATVSVLGELRKINPGYFNDVKLVLAGGSRHHLLKEEMAEEEKIRQKMEAYALTSNDVIRIYGHLERHILAPIIGQCLGYIGMQIMEPFGMGTAEAMAARALVIISEAAGITKWLKDGEDSIIVYPHDAVKTAEKISAYLTDKSTINRISKNGYKLARQHFSWAGIARMQGELIDKLLEGPIRERKRDFHREVPVWTGKNIIVSEKDKENAAILYKKIREKDISEVLEHVRTCKPSTALYLKYLLRRCGIFTGRQELRL